MRRALYCPSICGHNQVALNVTKHTKTPPLWYHDNLNTNLAMLVPTQGEATDLAKFIGSTHLICWCAHTRGCCSHCVEITPRMAACTWRCQRSIRSRRRCMLIMAYTGAEFVGTWSLMFWTCCKDFCRAWGEATSILGTCLQLSNICFQILLIVIYYTYEFF